MFCIRFLLFFILLVLVQAEPNSYIRGKRVIPASRIINTNAKTNAKPEAKPNQKDNDILEFRTVKTLTGSKPASPDIKYAGARW
jgi:hypothetical protein